MLYLATNLLGLVGLVGLFYLAGWVLDQVLLKGRGLEPVSVAGRFGLGAATWMGWVFLLATVQMLTRPALGLVALATLVAAWLVARAGSRSRSTPQELASTKTPDPACWVLGGFLGAVLVALWLQVLWPQISWDSNAYHLTVPRLYLEHGGFRRIPFNVYSNWPLNTQLLFALAMAFRDHVLAKAIHFAFGIATVGVVYQVVKTGSHSWAGWLGAILFLANPVVLDEFRAAYVDLAFGFFLVLAFFLLHRRLEDPGDRPGGLILVGVLAGVAAGIKPTGVMVVVCLLVLHGVAVWRQGQGPRQLLTGTAQIALPAVLLLMPWALKSWILTGNPVYPFLYPLLGGPEWSAELGDQLRQWQQGMGMGRSWLDYLLLPFRVVVLGRPGYDSFDGRISPLWLVLIPLALLRGRRHPLIARSLAVAGVYFVLWALSSQQMRFLIPVLPLLAIAGALSLADIQQGLGARVRPVFKWTVSLALVALLAIVGGPMVRPAGRMFLSYMDQGEAVLSEGVHPVFRFIEEELPRKSKLMFLNTNHGFFCRREFVADSFFEASQINHLLRSRQGKEGVGESLRELGITHLLVENRDRFVPWPESLYQFLNDPQRARQIYRSPDKVYDVIEIVGSPSSGS